MNIDGSLGVRSQGSAYHGTKRQVGHIVVVHDIEVYPVSTGRNDVANFFAQAGKVGR
jgi:hypothetical protein